MSDCQALGFPSKLQNPIIEENSNNIAFHWCCTEFHFGSFIFIGFMQIYIIQSEELKAPIHLNVPPQKEHRNRIIQKTCE